MTSFIIGIDVGGTFTDLVAIDDTGNTVFAKSPSTPEDQSLGVLNGLEELAKRLGLDRTALLQQTRRIVHGTTVATNALLERKGAKVALLTTEGHRDVLEMREGLKGDRYDLRTPPPEPLVPRQLRIGVRERVRADGSVLTPLDDTSLANAIAQIKASGVTSVAICYLHAYRNPDHEIETEKRIRAALPDVFVSRSSDVLPQIKEFERVSTTVVNAYVGPAVHRYLSNLKQRLDQSGFTGSLFVILSHGGMAPVEEAARLAAATVLSGPAGGVAGSRRCATLLDLPNLVPFDMGGTSTDISLIADGQATLSAERGLAGERIALRSLDIASIGAGGGSIAYIDAAGSFQVGPESAGARPGPACYGHGGTKPTVTDANLVLGYLDAASFAGGARPLDLAAAQTAVDTVAGPLGLTQEAAAAGIYRLINLKMADGIRLMTLRRGVDPRKFTLLSFGGAAGLHAVEVARELEIPRVIVPTVASVLSAWGMLASDLRYEVSRTHIGENAVMNDASLRDIFRRLEDNATARLTSWFDDNIRIERSAEMRYGEQIFEIDVTLDNLNWAADGLIGRVHEAFHQRHEELYTYASRDQEVVFVNARASAVGVIQSVNQPSTSVAMQTNAAPRTHRSVFFRGYLDTPVYDIAALKPGAMLAGPAILEAETTTVVASEGDRVSVNALGWLDIKLRSTAAD